MPSPKGWDLPPPEHAQEFEVLCLELMAAIRNPVVPATLYGRSGQRQHGLDFVLQLRDGLHGYQCKRVKAFTIEQLRAELKKA